MIYRGTTTEVILKIILYKTHTYKQVEEMVRKHRQFKDTPSESIRSTLSRLKKKKLVARTKSGWKASNLTWATLGSRSDFNKINQEMIKSRQKQKDRIIVMYDIPEKLKYKRMQLREGLKILGFVPKQLSVWIGPAPLPKEFIEFLGELKILKYINFFRVKEENVV